MSKLSAVVQKNAETLLGQFSSKLHLYIRDDKTEDVLVKAVKGAVMATYKQFLALIQLEYEARVMAASVTLHDIRVALDKSMQAHVTTTNGGAAATPTTPSPVLQ